MFGNDMNHIVEKFNEFYINNVSEIFNGIPKNDRYYQIEQKYNRFEERENNNFFCSK